MLRCPECRTRRATYASMQRHIHASGHDYCNCEGYHFQHRPGSGCCDQNPRGAIVDARRRGASAEEILDILIDIIWDSPGETGGAEPPF